MYTDHRPGVPITLVSSAARTTSSNSGNLKDTTGSLPTGSQSYDIYWNVTALSPGNVQVSARLETSPDGGTTWLTAAQFAPITSVAITTTSITRRLSFQNGYAYGAAGTENYVGAYATASAAAVSANTRLSPDVRVTWDLGAAGTSCTFAVFAIVEP